MPADLTTASVTPEQRKLIAEAARRGGFVDYRMLLRTHLFASALSRYKWGPRTHDAVTGAEADGIAQQFFDLAAWVILAGVQTTVAGGSEITIGELIQRVWSYPQDRAEPHISTPQILNANALMTRSTEFSRIWSPSSPAF